MAKEETQKPCVATLPTELHLRIRVEVLKDPDTSFDDYKFLRLVCKRFNDIWSPIVLAHISLFPDTLTNDLIVERLGHLHSICGKDGSPVIRTITLRNWDKLNSALQNYYTEAKEIARRYQKQALFMIPLYVLAFPPSHFFSALSRPDEIPDRLRTTTNLVRARKYAALLGSNPSLSNVSCVRLLSRPEDSHWGIERTTRIIVALPQLTELELRLMRHTGLTYICQRLESLNSLRKFTLRILPAGGITYKPPRTSLACFSSIVSQNPDLTHLTIGSMEEAPYNFADIMSAVPANRPLKLEHVGFDGFCTHIEALIPHIQSLSSLEVHSMRKFKGTWFRPIMDANIFPSTITTDSLEPDLCEYLESHPAIVKLTMHDTGGLVESWRNNPLSRVLALHCGTLQSLTVTVHTLAVMLGSVENEANFLQCTRLTELVLTEDSTQCRGIGVNFCPYESVYHEKQILPVVARLNNSMTVVIKQESASTFRESVGYCRNSDNSLVRALVGRIVYEKSESPDAD